MKTLEELIKEIEKEFNERFLCSVNPDIWMPTYANSDNPSDEDREAPEPTEVKEFLRQSLHHIAEETLKIDKKKIKEIMKITKEGK